jgi:hypothetical protein
MSPKNQQHLTALSPDFVWEGPGWAPKEQHYFLHDRPWQVRPTRVLKLGGRCKAVQLVHFQGLQGRRDASRCSAAGLRPCDTTALCQASCTVLVVLHTLVLTVVVWRLQVVQAFWQRLVQGQACLSTLGLAPAGQPPAVGRAPGEHRTPCTGRPAHTTPHRVTNSDTPGALHHACMLAAGQQLPWAPPSAVAVVEGQGVQSSPAAKPTKHKPDGDRTTWKVSACQTCFQC